MHSTLGDKRLKCFLTAVESGSIRAAADELLLEPSMVSRQIMQLEAELGVTLLERRGRGVFPTPSGEVVMEHCRDRWGLEHNLREKLNDLSGLRRGELRIAISEGFLDEFIERVLSPFSASYPDVVINIILQTASEVVRMVATDEAHLGVTLHAQRDNRVRILADCPHPIFAIVSPRHALSNCRSPLSLADFAKYPLVLAPVGSGLRSLADSAAFVERVEMEPRFVVNSVRALKAITAANNAVTFLPKISLQQELDQGDLFALSSSNAVLQSACAQVLVRRGRTYSSALSALVKVISESRYFSEGSL
ncbi:LysR family transcriptional regulator [Paraburkholderia terrae]|uniref:LysR family transcriptional regulator n=1 Tax=Paraburkholderia terrae TaxID=311230 RepID=A0A2I8F523_9BURK|nr:LysR family transcriptional regulator [Paraburkholderia terrae]AUT66762.1 LysR family transcriptional regulator [Paraburkholderia terrae]